MLARKTTWTLALVAGSIAAPALAQDATGDATTAPPAPFVDESSVWFEVTNHEESNGGPPQNVGWSLAPRMRLWGSVPRHSAFRFVMRQGARPLGELRCEVHVGTGYVEADGGCYDDAQRIRAAGTIQVDASWIDGDTDAETPIRTYTLEIATVTRTRGGGVADATRQYVDANGSILDNVITQVQPWSGGRHVRLLVHASTPESGYGAADSIASQMRCRVDGQPVALPDRHNQVDVTWLAQPFLQIVHSRDQPRVATPIRDYVSYRIAEIVMPITWGDTSSDDVRLEDHPGRWECDWRVNGRTLRTFRWTVADGRIQPHPEEATGLRFGEGVHLLETVIPGETIIDQRVEPAAVRRGGFYGRAWVSDEARAMAAAVPAVGEPRPPQPRSPGFVGAAEPTASASRPRRRR